MIRRTWYSGVVFAFVLAFDVCMQLGKLVHGQLDEEGAVPLLISATLISAVLGGTFYVIYRTKNAFAQFRPSKRFAWGICIPIVLFALIGLKVGLDVGHPQTAVVAPDPLPPPAADERASAASVAVADEINRDAELTPEEREQENEQWVIGIARKLTTAQGTVHDSVWNATRDRLKSISQTSENHKQAQQLFTSMVLEDKKADAEERRLALEAKNRAVALAKAQEPAEISARKDFAQSLERQYLEQRMDTKVRATGPKSTNLSIEWIYASRVTAHDLSKGDVLTQASILGFKSAHFFNGLDGELAEGYTWKLAH